MACFEERDYFNQSILPAKCLVWARLFEAGWLLGSENERGGENT